MDPYILDAFTKVPFGGNPAGAVILSGDYPVDAPMLALAAMLGFSETAFILPLGDNAFRLRYFTPTEEVPLCGHATIASFHLLNTLGCVQGAKTCLARTAAGELNIDLDPDGCVWMDMARPEDRGELSGADCRELCACFGLAPADIGGLSPAIAGTGLADIILPVRDRAILDRLQPDMAAISALSERLSVVGVHAFAPGGDGVTAYVRNFAPLIGIPEEAATGTANGALSYYLSRRGHAESEMRFIQGEAMGRASEIRSRVHGDAIRVGGYAVIREGRN